MRHDQRLDWAERRRKFLHNRADELDEWRRLAPLLAWLEADGVTPGGGLEKIIDELRGLVDETRSRLTPANFASEMDALGLFVGGD